MSIGIYEHTWPRGHAGDGWDPQNPTKQTISHPVKKVASIDGTKPDFIWAGMVITQTANGTHWQRGVEAGVTPTIVCIAQDCSVDEDVNAANSLVGLSCSDKFTIFTPFFARNAGNVAEPHMYLAGTAITYCKAGETEKRVIGGDQVDLPLEGFVRPAQKGEPVIGVIRHHYTGINGAAPAVQGATPTATNSVCGAEPLQATFETTTLSGVNRENAYFIQFDTAFSPVV